MKVLKGKKLLVLGGNKLSCDIVRAAQQMGVYVIVTDWNKLEDSPAKAIADEYAMLSLSDIDGISTFIKDKNIDGVITGFTDSYLEYYIEICKRNELPCYLDKNSLRLTLDKDLFKKVCSEHGLGTIPEYGLENILKDREIIADKYPLLIKPVDNSGSRGVIKCDTQDQLDECIDFALSNSKSKHILIEEYFDKDDVSVAYVFRDGEAYLSATCDRMIRKTDNGGSVTAGLIYPSKYTHAFIDKCDAKLKKLFEDYGFKNGVLFLQAFADDENFYFYEMGYRLSGGRHYISTKDQNGVSAVEMLVEFALTGDMGEEIQKETALFPEVCGVLYAACRGGAVIGQIDGIDEISRMPQVLDCTQSLKSGDTVGREGTTAQNVARIHFKVKAREEISKMAENIKEKLTVTDDQGKNILCDFII